MKQEKKEEIRRELHEGNRCIVLAEGHLEQAKIALEQAEKLLEEKKENEQ